MPTKRILTQQQLQPASYAKPLLIGAGIALAVISVFVFGADNPPAKWGPYWRIRPLIVTPLAGAGGGAFFSLMHRLNVQGGWKVLSVVIGALGFVIALWMGTVLGLAGTMWD